MLLKVYVILNSTTCDYRFVDIKRTEEEAMALAAELKELNRSVGVLSTYEIIEKEI